MYPPIYRILVYIINSNKLYFKKELRNRFLSHLAKIFAQNVKSQMSIALSAC